MRGMALLLTDEGRAACDAKTERGAALINDIIAHMMRLLFRTHICEK